MGESVPVNQKLSDIFLQLHISERSGRGVPKITEIYGRDIFDFRENSIVVNIPFNFIHTELSDKVVDKMVDKVVDKSHTTPDRILLELRDNPNITQPKLAAALGLSKTTIQNGIATLKKEGLIVRIGSNKDGYWKVLDL